MILSSSLFGQLNVETSETAATYEVGESMTFQISSNSSSPISWVLKYDKHAPIISSGTINGSSGVVSYTGTNPGAVLCEVTQGNNKAIASAVFDPFDIQPFEQEPADFDAFWNSQKALLAAVPLNPVVTLYSTSNFSKTYRVTLDHIDNRKVYGYLTVPDGVGPFPGVVVMPPYGNVTNIALPEIDLAEKGGMLAFAISIHNAPPDQIDSNAYQPDDYSDKEGNYYRYAFLAGVRAIDYIFSRPDFDGANFVMSGVSQGAGLATVVAGLDGRVDFLTISNPALCQTTGLSFDREASFPNFILQSRNNFGTAAHEAATREASKYYDAAFFARRFNGPSMVMLSYEDVVTPVATGLAAFNQLEGPKILVHSTELDHSHPFEYWVGRFEFYRRHLPSTINTAPFPWNPNTTGYYIDAGADVSTSGSSVSLSGLIQYNSTNDPNYEINWRKISGPGNVTFSNSTSYNTTATFSQSGVYTLEMRGEDDALLNNADKFVTVVDYVTVTVGTGGGDVTPPTATLTTSSNNVTAPFVVNVNFSENISGLSPSDLLVTNGAASNLSGSGSNYSYVVTPTSAGQVTVTLPQGSVLDLASNPNALPSNTLVVNYSTGNTDTTPPVATLSTASNTVNGAFDISVSFSETITGLSLSDFVISNSTLSGLVGTGANYTVTATPISSGQVTVLLPDDTVVDDAGNSNNASSNTIAVTYTAPNTGDCNSPINLAFNKITTQVSTQFNAIGGRAVDGITDGDFWVANSTSLTSWVQNAWWEVDLGAIADVTDIKIWNRSDCCSDILDDYHVMVSDVPFTSTNLNATLNQTGVSDFFQTSEAGYPTNVAANRTGRYVRIQLDDQGFLALAEVEVMGCFSAGTLLNQNITFANIPDKLTIDNPFSVAASASSGLPVSFNVSGPATLIGGNTIVLNGTPGVVVIEATQSGSANYNPAPSETQSFTVSEPSPSNCNVVTNIALGKTSIQNGTQLSADAGRANDGNTSGDFWNGNSVSLTNWTPNAWWEVDLGQVGNIDKINVWNRTDCCSERLADYFVLVSDVPFTSTNLNTTLGQSGVSDFFQSQEAGAPSEINIGRSGRYVRIQLQGTSFLALAEVEVMGCFDGTGCPALGTACDDNNPATTNDIEDGNCNCAGTPCPTIGTICNDGNPNTENDVEDGNCNCAGTPIGGTDCTTTTNVALNKTVSQISTVTAGSITGSAAKAIDGNTNGTFFISPASLSSVSATQNQNEAWWEVDLGSHHFIEDINVYNRTDGVDRTRDAYVLISDTPFSSDDLATSRSEADYEYLISGLVGSPTAIAPQIEGRYVRVQLTGTAYLVLAEVEVMGCTISNLNSNINNTLIALPNSEFLFFDVKKNNREVRLDWVTNMEPQNDFFTIEKSSDGINFEFMTEIESRSNSLSAVGYSDLDTHPYFGKNYYRLRQTLKDGTEIYSNVFEVEFDLDLMKFSIFPNPAKDIVYVNLKSFEGEKGKIQIYDARGILVQERSLESISSYPERFDVKNYVNGLYLMTIKIENHKLITKQILIKNLY